MKDRSLILEELQARVAELERLLAARSAELRVLQRVLSLPDLLVMTRVLAGSPALRGLSYWPESWEEGNGMRRAEVKVILKDLWRASPVVTEVDESVPAAVAFPIPRLEEPPGVGDPRQWSETTAVSECEVEPAMETVWISPPEGEDP